MRHATSKIFIRIYKLPIEISDRPHTTSKPKLKPGVSLDEVGSVTLARSSVVGGHSRILRV